MPTRKELLEELRNEVEQLSSTVSLGSESLQSVNEGLERHGQTQVDAAQIISDGLTNASETVLGAVVVGSFLWLAGKAVGALVDRMSEINRKTSMIKSIQRLQQTNSPLSYEFIVERSFADGAGKDERQSILNELLYDQIVTATKSDVGEILSIESDNPKLLAYWEWLDSLGKVGTTTNEPKEITNE